MSSAFLELRDEMGKPGEADKTMFKEEEDILAVIVSLGYSAREAKDALKQAPKTLKTSTPALKKR